MPVKTVSPSIEMLEKGANSLKYSQSFKATKQILIQESDNLQMVRALCCIMIKEKQKES